MIESGTKLTFVAMLLFVAATCWKGHWGLAAAQLLLVVLLLWREEEDNDLLLALGAALLMGDGT